jgi:putative holliday junction resolvase
MRTLAVDLGTRRVGLALSDAGGTLATPLDVLQITSVQQAADRIVETIDREGVERIVIGLPLNMDDSLGSAARSTIAWGRDLAARTGKPVLFVDERLSSFDAEQTLADRKRSGEKLTHKRKKQQLDAIAAAAVLQAFLDGKLAPVEF